MDWLIFGAVCAAAVWLYFEIRRAPVEPFDRNQAQEDHDAAQECIEASRPAELRPHVKAGTAWGREV